jgi:hypothetical protein
VAIEIAENGNGGNACRNNALSIEQATEQGRRLNDEGVRRRFLHGG